MNTSVKINIKKTRKGKINKIVEEIYLRDDITTPLLESTGMDVEINTIYILDTETFIKQIDLIENCPVLNNVIVLQTILEEIKAKDQKVFETLKNLIEIETHRNFNVFANEYFRILHTPKDHNETWQQRNQRAIFKAVKWYADQAKIYKKDLVFITNNFKAYEIAKNEGIPSKTIYDFVNQHGAQYPDLLDYLGFDDTVLDTEEEGNIIYEHHLPIDDAIAKVRKGELFEGKLSISKNNVEEGRIFLGKYGIEIKIFGRKNLNRGLAGDRVVVEILPESEWQKLKIADLEEEEEPLVEKELIEDVEDRSDLKKIFEKIRKDDLTPAGRVVAVVKRVSRNFCGHLEPLTQERNLKEEFEIREFVPADSRYPRIYVKLRNNGSLDDKKIIVKIDSWGVSSLYPKGHFVSVIGKIGDDYTEGNVILLEHNVEIKNFSKHVMDCLPSAGENWKIPEEEYKTRRDFRDICVCSIDPPGCRDIDDALHCRPLPNGNFEVGVHIADVSYFVRPDTAIDLEAANRCTTVYLVGRRTDMLPKLLTEVLCSLRCNVERLTFSVIWEITPNAEIVNVEYTKGIINSRASLTYGDAQKMVDDPNDNSELATSIKNLNRIAKIIRKGRVDQGALTLASTQVKFSFDEETHNPTDVSLYQLVETNYLVEEFMLLANVAVAEKTLYHFPSNSILRRHSTPKPKQIKEFGKLLNTLGYSFDYSSSKNLADSLDMIQRKDDTFFNKLVRILTTRTMNEANYFCTSDFDYPEFHHYGLAASCYTHFTSPIRRYADVLVHRLLAASIDIESLPKSMCNKQRLTKICDKMNMRHRNARNASRASSDYHTFLFFRGKKNEERAAISNITYNGFTVILEKYGLEGFIQLSPEDEKQHQARIKELTEKDTDYIVNDVYIQGQLHKMFDYILIRISVEMEHFHKKINVEYIRKL